MPMTDDPMAMSALIAGGALVAFAPRKNVIAGRTCVAVGTLLTGVTMFLETYRENVGTATMIAALIGCTYVAITARWSSLLSVPGGDDHDIGTIAAWWAAALGVIAATIVVCQSLAGRMPWWPGVTAVVATVAVAVALGVRDAAHGHRLASDQLLQFALATAGTLGVFAICYLPAYQLAALRPVDSTPR
jgi:GNAT superfamily N-acetyltransferase